MNPIFSIIIPTYNSGSTLLIALESIITQESTDFEVLIVDGSSTDNTLEVMRTFAAADSRFKWISEGDKGVYDAMNKGINMAQGDWLYFLGSDDYLLNNTILKNVENFISNASGVNVIYGNATSPYVGKKYDGPFNLIKLTTQNICHQAIFYKKEIFSLVGNYNLRYKIHADWDLNLRCFLHPKIKTKYIDIIIAYFSGGGLSHREDDLLFRSEKDHIVAHSPFHTIPFRHLKFFCKSNVEFLGLVLKRALYFVRTQITNSPVSK